MQLLNKAIVSIYYVQLLIFFNLNHHDIGHWLGSIQRHW